MDVAEIQTLTGEIVPEAKVAQATALAPYILGLIGMEAHRRFEVGAWDSVEKVNGNMVLLPQPVTVESVTLTDGFPVQWEMVGDGGTGAQVRVWGAGVSSAKMVRICGTAPGEAVPDMVKMRVAQIVMRVLRADPQAARGVSQHSETTGPFSTSDSFAPWSVGGDPVLSPEDKAFARALRRPQSGNVWVMQS